MFIETLGNKALTDEQFRDFREFVIKILDAKDVPADSIREDRPCNDKSSGHKTTWACTFKELKLGAIQVAIESVSVDATAVMRTSNGVQCAWIELSLKTNKTVFNTSLLQIKLEAERRPEGVWTLDTH